MSLVVDLRNHPLFSVPSLKSSWRCSPYPSILCCLSVFITVLLRLRKPNPYPTSLLIQPQISILFHLVHLPLLSTYRPSHNLFSKSCCGFAPSEGVLGAPIGPSSSFLFRFLVLLAGACVRGSDLLALLRCWGFGGENWLGLFLVAGSFVLCCEPFVEFNEELIFFRWLDVWLLARWWQLWRSGCVGWGLGFFYPAFLLIGLWPTPPYWANLMYLYRAFFYQQNCLLCFRQ